MIMSNATREKIILAMLSLGEEKGLSNVSLSDISMAVGIRKASIYSHFDSQEAIVDAMVSYCQNILGSKDFKVDFKAAGPQQLLQSLVESFLETFAEEPLCSFFSIIQQQRMFSPRFREIHRKLVFMITARIRVALEYCIQRSWLSIADSDAASDLLCAQVLQCLCDAIVPDPSHDMDWELDRLVSGMLVLFADNGS